MHGKQESGDNRRASRERILLDYCGRNNPNQASWKPFAPRVGIAYSMPDGKTVIRAGYGVYFDSFETREIDNSGDIYPYIVRAAPNATTDSTLPKTTDGLFPIITQHIVSPATDGNQFFAVIISEKWQNPYVQQWSLSLQRQLSTYTTLEFSYVGNKGTHLLDRVNIGQPAAAFGPGILPGKSVAGRLSSFGPQTLCEYHLGSRISRQPLRRLVELQRRQY